MEKKKQKGKTPKEDKDFFIERISHFPSQIVRGSSVLRGCNGEYTAIGSARFSNLFLVIEKRKLAAFGGHVRISFCATA
jgi:hypothetical protein